MRAIDYGAPAGDLSQLATSRTSHGRDRYTAAIDSRWQRRAQGRKVMCQARKVHARPSAHTHVRTHAVVRVCVPVRHTCLTHRGEETEMITHSSYLLCLKHKIIDT